MLASLNNWLREKYGYTDSRQETRLDASPFFVSLNTELVITAPTELYDESDGELSDVEDGAR